MSGFVYSALDQGRPNIAKTLLIIYESFVQRLYPPQMVDIFFLGSAKAVSFHFLLRSRRDGIL